MQDGFADLADLAPDEFRQRRHAVIGDDAQYRVADEMVIDKSGAGFQGEPLRDGIFSDTRMAYQINERVGEIHFSEYVTVMLWRISMTPEGSCGGAASAEDIAIAFIIIGRGCMGGWE